MRLVHLAAGIVPLQIEIRGQDGVLLSKTLAYPNANRATPVEETAKELTIAAQEGTALLPATSLSLGPQTLTDVFTVGGLHAPDAIEVVVAPNVKRDSSI